MDRYLQHNQFSTYLPRESLDKAGDLWVIALVRSSKNIQEGGPSD